MYSMVGPRLQSGQVVQPPGQKTHALPILARPSLIAPSFPDTAMQITDARVIVSCPGRNFVTLKIETDEGLTGLGDATLNGRELAVASYLTDHVIPTLIRRGAHRIEGTRQYLYPRRHLRRGSGTMTAHAAPDT